jgi:hypothetical protein
MKFILCYTVSVVRSRTQATEFSFLVLVLHCQRYQEPVHSLTDNCNEKTYCRENFSRKIPVSSVIYVWTIGHISNY